MDINEHISKLKNHANENIEFWNDRCPRHSGEIDLIGAKLARSTWSGYLKALMDIEKIIKENTQ